MNKHEARLRYYRIGFYNALVTALMVFFMAFSDYRITKVEIFYNFIVALGVFFYSLKEIFQGEIDMYKASQLRVLNFF